MLKQSYCYIHFTVLTLQNLVFVSLIFSAEQLLNMRPPFQHHSAALTTAKLWVKTPHWGTHPYCILMELRDFFFFFEVPHPYMSRVTTFPSPASFQLSNHDHSGEKSMLNLFCTLHGRWRNVPLSAGGQRSAWRCGSLAKSESDS